MAATTEGAIFRELLADLKTLVTSIVHADRVYLRAVPGFDKDVSPPYVQLVPGSASELHPYTGDNVIRQTFTPHIFERMNLDEWGQDTVKFSDSTHGILRIRDLIRGDGGLDGTPSGFIHSYLTAGGIFPIVLMAFSSPSVNPADPSWISCSDTFRIQWEIM